MVGGGDFAGPYMSDWTLLVLADAVQPLATARVEPVHVLQRASLKVTVQGC